MNYKKLSKNAVGCMMLATFIGFFILWISIGVAYYLFADLLSNELNSVINLAMIGLGVITFVNVFIAPFIRYHRYKYIVNKDRIDVHEGFIWTNRNIVPIERIKQITLKRGPIDQIFKLSKVVVTTSGGSVTIRFLQLEEADNIANNLNDKINESIRTEKDNAKKEI